MIKIVIIRALIILTFWDESTFVRVQLGKLLPAQRIPWSRQKKHVEDDDGDEDDGDEDEEDDDVKNVDDEERWRPDLLLGLSTAVKSVPELGELGLIDSLVSVLVGLP